MFYDPKTDEIMFGQIVVVGALAIIMLSTLAAFGCPHYTVWQQHMVGRAALAKAEQDRQIAVAESKAKLDSAVNLGAAEVERAKGTAEANRIIGQSLAGNEAYLRWLYIQGITEGDAIQREIIYLPTEAGIPILEAQRGARHSGG
jgi:hypothetical protein